MVLYQKICDDWSIASLCIVSRLVCESLNSLSSLLADLLNTLPSSVVPDHYFRKNSRAAFNPTDPETIRCEAWIRTRKRTYKLS